MNHTPEDLWTFLPLGYAFTILIETPIIMLLLSGAHPLRRRVLCGVWLTAFTYPIVILVLPTIMNGFSYSAYLWVAEIFAPMAEVLLFGLAFWNRSIPTIFKLRDAAAIGLANLASFGIGWALG